MDVEAPLPPLEDAPEDDAGFAPPPMDDDDDGGFAPGGDDDDVPFQAPAEEEEAAPEPADDPWEELDPLSNDSNDADVYTGTNKKYKEAFAETWNVLSGHEEALEENDSSLKHSEDDAHEEEDSDEEWEEEEEEEESEDSDDDSDDPDDVTRVCLLDDGNKANRPIHAYVSLHRKHDPWHLLAAFQRNGIVRVGGNSFRFREDCCNVYTKHWPDDDPGLEPLIKIYDDCIANNYIINEDGDWIDANGQLLDKAEAAARDAHFEKHPNDPVIARGCTVHLTGKGKHQAVPKVTPKGCFYLVGFSSCFVMSRVYDGIGGPVLHGGRKQRFSVGAAKIDPTLAELKEDTPRLNERGLSYKCPKIYDALMKVAQARDVPDALRDRANIAIPVYMSGIKGGDSKGDHRDSAAALLIKYRSKDYPYKCALLPDSTGRFGLTCDAADTGTIEVSGEHCAIFSSQAANTVQRHKVDSSKDAQHSSFTVAFFSKSSGRDVSDPALTTALVATGYKRLRPSLKVIDALNRDHFSVGISARKAEDAAEKERKREEAEAGKKRKHEEAKADKEPKRKKRKEGDIRKRGSGASGFYGVRKEKGARHWRVVLVVDGRKLYPCTCENEEDAARLANVILVLVRGDAPKNLRLSQRVVELLGTGCVGDIPAELVAAAKEALRRVGHVEVKGAESVEVAEARAAASSVEAKIAAAVAKPENHSRASMPLSDAGYDSGLGTWDKSLKTKWNAEQGRHMEAKGVKTVRNLALVNMDNMKLLLTLALCDDTASGRLTARRKLWNWKGAAAALVGVDDIGKLPKQSIVKNGRPPKQELTTKEQDALDVAMRWAASRAGTVDEELATKYAEALADIARRQLSKEGSGGDDGAEPTES